MRPLQLLTFILALCILLLCPLPRASAQACAFSLQPGSPTVCVGGSFSLSVNTVGFGGNVTYQWYLNNIPIGNSNVQTLTVNNVTLTDAGPYKCLVTRSGGLGNCSSFSNVGNVTVNVPPMAQADSVAQLFCNNVNTPYRLRVLATSGTAPLSYHWLRNGTPIANGGRFSGVDTPELYCNQPFSGDTGGTWACQVSNSCGSVMITVPSPVQSAPPAFLQPLPPIIPVIFGQSFSLTSGSTDLGVNSRSWYVNGSPLLNQPNEPFSTYSGPLPGQATIWTNPVLAIHADAQIELRLTNTCNDSNSSFTRLLTANASETEPNNDKAHANVFTVQGGDQIIGAAGASDPADCYRIISPPTGPAIHRRTIRLESTDGSHTMVLRGLRQQGGALTTEERDVQAATELDGVPSLRYYTCGETNDSFVNLVVSGSNAATATLYRLAFIDEPVTPLTLSGPPLEANTPFTIATMMQPSTFYDTEFWCTDARGNAIPGFGNDDKSGGSNPLIQSYLARTTSGPGASMRVAVSTYNLANNQLAAPDDGYTNGNVVDSPNVTLTSQLIALPTPAQQPITLVVTQNGIDRTAVINFQQPLDVLWYDLPVRSCSPADLGSQGGITGPDNLLDNNDFIAFIDLFFNADPKADLGIQGGILGHDGAFDNNDFIAFINLFFAGCS